MRIASLMALIIGVGLLLAAVPYVVTYNGNAVSRGDLPQTVTNFTSPLLLAVVGFGGLMMVAVAAFAVIRSR